MEVASGSGADVQSVMGNKLAQTAGNVSLGVAKKAMTVEKFQGSQIVDMIKKAGSTFDVTA
jgi:hypothetical protein